MNDLEITIYRNGTLFCRFRMPDTTGVFQDQYITLIKERFKTEDGFAIYAELVSEVRTNIPV